MMTKREKKACENCRDLLAELTDCNAHSEAAFQCANFFERLWDSKNDGGDGFAGRLNPFLVYSRELLEIWREHERTGPIDHQLYLARYYMSEACDNLARELYPEQAEIVLAGL